MAAINPDGSLAWASSPAPTTMCRVSALNNINPTGCLATDAQDNVYWSVKVHPAATGSGLVRDNALLFKFNASGQLQWTKQAVGQAGQYDVEPTSLRADQAGNLYWGVWTYGSSFTLDNATYGGTGGQCLLKLTAGTGQVQWGKGNVFQFAPSSNNSGSGYYDIAGLDEAAGKLYFCVTARGYDIVYNGPGSPVVAPANPQVGRLYLAQTDLNAQVEWVKPLANLTLPSTTSTYYLYNTLVYPSGTGLLVLTSTLYNGTTNFVGDATTYSAAQAGLVVVARFNPATGLTEWVRTGGTDYGEFDATSQLGTSATNLAVDAAGNAYVAGLFHGPAHLGSQVLSPNFKFKTYLAKLDQTVLATRLAVAGRPWQPYPNPATGTVQLSGLPTGAHVTLLDALGRTVRQTTAPTLSLGGLAAGLYLLQVAGTPDPYQPQRLTVE